jgi:enoyl-CoA hydratase/carnithine racemase
MLVDEKDLGSGVRMLTLNRPPANAIGREFLEALFDACRGARDDASVRAVVVTGAGKFFSGGLDLKEASSGIRRVGNLAGSPDDGIFALWTLPKPTVAMVNGHAIAGGVIIALACDFRITCNGGHRLGLNEVAIGMGFPRGAYEIARLALTNEQLRWTLLGARTFDVKRARELGIIDEIVEPAQLEARCVELAQGLAANGQLAYAHTKRRLQERAVARVLGQKAEEARELGEIGRSDESRALLASQVQSLGKR